MSEQDFVIEDATSISGKPWLSLHEQKTGLILFRYRLQGHFNLVERLFKPDYRGSDFLEGRVDTKCHLNWGDDVDVRKVGALKENKESKNQSDPK